jgi:hypothetical protein
MKKHPLYQLKVTKNLKNPPKTGLPGHITVTGCTLKPKPATKR